MAFKMRGNPYKMGTHKTKKTMAYMKSPLEQQLRASNIKQDESIPGEGMDFSHMTPAWIGDKEAMKDQQKKKERLSFLFDSEDPVELGGQGRPLTDEEHAEYLALKDEVEEMDRQWHQSQEGLGEGEGSIPAQWEATGRRKEMEK